MEPNMNNNQQQSPGQPPEELLNQPAEQPLGATPSPVEPVEPTGAVSATEAVPTAEATPVAEPTPAAETVSAVETAPIVDSAPATGAEPATEATPAAGIPGAVVTPAKKTNKPLIITLICILLALGITAAVCFALFPSGSNSGGGTGDNPGGGDQPNTPTFELGEFSDFDLKFLQLENKQANAIYSPLSIKYALGMLSEAADGDSYTQIHNLIGDFTPKKYTNSEHRSLANAMFIRETQKDRVLSSYQDNLSSKYGAEVIYDSFASVDPINNWVSTKTFGIINNLLSSPIDDTDFALVNALAIDMNWNNQLQCKEIGSSKEIPCMYYTVIPKHEDYMDSVGVIYVDDDERGFKKIQVNGKDVKAADIGATANRYDIMSELGEEQIRATVLAAYDEWLEEHKEGMEKNPNSYGKFDIDKYMEELAANYNAIKSSTDFYFNDTDNEKVFAKDLQEYDGSTLQYVAIMPKTESLSSYVSNTSAEKLGTLIGGLKDASKAESFKDGVVTRFSAYIPMFEFDYNLNLKEDLQTLGITDVFDKDKANLGNLATYEEGSEYNAYISNAIHKANIDFSNEGIRAAAATVFLGGLGSGGITEFDYKWDVPVEEIDLSFDQPFMFLIRDKASGEIWFTGTFYNIAS